MKYNQKKFTVGSTSGEAQKRYTENWDRIFGKKKPAPKPKTKPTGEK